MNRREALSATALLFGGAVIGGPAFLAGCRPQVSSQASFGTDDLLLLDEIGETIIPATADSPGAKAALIGSFMATIVKDCYEEKDQMAFTDGIVKVKEVSKKTFGKAFMKLSPDERKRLLVAIDKEAKQHDKNKAEASPVHYFTMMKQLTTWGYFTSKPGATQALRYVPVPGRYEGCIPYENGQKAWAP